MKPLSSALSLAAGSLAIAGTALLMTGCSKPAEPVPASSSPASLAVRPTEKSVIQTNPRAFNQNSTAADGIRALEADGYNVEINWGGGRTDQNLALCRMGSVDGLRGSGAVTPGTSVYVTVIC